FCLKCRRARPSPMRTYCECSGRYVNAEAPASFAATLAVFRGIAAAFRFRWLADTVEALLNADAAS
ncbi:MAG: hypothetical protein OJK14_14010, partial [Achromobacter sp.]|uniref:hypothetical protein n=1 Tax=Achromobacter sp. TaxID=134375 RepID=UPI00258C4020